MREALSGAEKTILTDPLCQKPVEAVRLKNEAGLELVCVPDRALDLYSLRLDGKAVSYTNPQAGISPENFAEDGTEGFAKNFFVGFLTTCGLIQSGRPCQEAGRRFGLHGRISNTPCSPVEIWETQEDIHVRGTAQEVHPAGEHMRLLRTLRLDKHTPTLEIHDRVTNLGAAPTPYMIMYHINFGEPFLSPKLKISADFTYIEDRDTGTLAPLEAVTGMGTQGTRGREKVFYTQADLQGGVLLENREAEMGLLLTAQGDGLDWLGIWQSFHGTPAILGIEPCNCPGLGRVNARKRGLLPLLSPGETRENRILASFYRPT